MSFRPNSNLCLKRHLIEFQQKIEDKVCIINTASEMHLNQLESQSMKSTDSCIIINIRYPHQATLDTSSKYEMLNSVDLFLDQHCTLWTPTMSPVFPVFLVRRFL